MTKRLQYDRTLLDVLIIDDDGRMVKAYLGVVTDPDSRMIRAVSVETERDEEKPGGA